MKTNSILTAIVLTTASAASIAFSQTGSSGASTNPAVPAAQAVPAAAMNPMPAPNQIIYLPQLPTAASLVNVAAAQGLSVEQISQTNTQIMVVYKYGNGQTNAICYQLLSTAGAVPTVASPAPVVVPAQTTVIYGTPAPAYYYDPFYYPWPWFGPVAVGLDFGFRGGYYHGGGFRGGGFHGGGHGWH
jgi:hypothetical protein